MSNLSVSHLIKCISEKDKYKFTQQYLKQVEMQNQTVYDIINEALGNMITKNTHHPTMKLYALRFFKDLILSAQFQLIDSLDESIIKQIVKISQFDKENKQKLKRGSLYFQQVQKRNKQPQLQKLSYSYVLLATQIIYVLGSWHAVDENNQQTDYAFIFQKLAKMKVPFPANDKELKFFKPQEKQLFMKNYKDWVDKLPQIEQLSDQDEKQNLQKSKKQLKSKQVIPLQKQPQEEVKKVSKSKIVEKQAPINSNNYVDIRKLGYQSDQTINSQKNLLQQRVKQLENSLQKVNVQLKAQQQTRQEIQEKFSKSENKNSQLQGKCALLQTQLAESQKKYIQAEQNRQRLHLEWQQQKLLVKKAALQKTDMQEKLTNSLKQSQSQLKQAQQKICRLQREIQQLNTIKNSYKSIMDDHNNKSKNQNHNIFQQNVEQQQKQIEEIVEFYTKEQIQFKQQIKELKERNQELQKEISQKNSVIQNIHSSLEERNQQILELKNQAAKKEDQDFNQFKQISPIKNQTKKSTANFFNSQPQLKIPIQQRTSNSMSQYLLNQTSVIKRINESKQNSFDTLKSRQNQHHQKGRNVSLGKTQKSQQKRKKIVNRSMNGKTFHFTNGDPYKSNEIIQSNLQKRPYLGLGRYNSHSSSSGDLWTVTPKVIQQKDLQFMNKKSALNLNKKRQLQQNSIAKNYGVQTLIPYIKSYFPQNQVINQQNNILFKSLCLCSDDRSKQAIFKNESIQIRLINDYPNKQSFILAISNVSYVPIKIQAVSTHQQFRIVGQKCKLIYPYNIAEFCLQTKVKDLNLRYPTLSLIVSSNLQQKVANTSYNIALPLTMLDFIQMIQEIPQLCRLDSEKIKILQSEKFALNKSLPSLRQCFPYLDFKSKLKSGQKSSKSSEQYWQGTLHHCFIQNIDVYMKMTQVQNQVSLQFWCRNDDKMSENYSKVMIQTLMYLLQ